MQSKLFAHEKGKKEKKKKENNHKGVRHTKEPIQSLHKRCAACCIALLLVVVED